jgi:cobalt-zinc-cadmium efflux system membrane fusion protein
MKDTLYILEALSCLALCSLLAGCGQKINADPKAEDPRAVIIERKADVNLVKPAHPELLSLTTATAHMVAPELKVTGVVSPDISRAIPVISVASGRILEIHARLGDMVTKGQLMLRVLSSDISKAFSEYRQAVTDEALAKVQLDRAKALFDRGAIAQKDLELAEETEAKARILVETTLDQLRVLGADPKKPTAIVDIVAPISGVVTDQQVTNAAGTQGLASPNPFVISDLSHVWIICDVYENNLAHIRLDEYADIRFNAYPGRVFKGRISNIGPVLDPNIRAAKVRIEMENPGLMRVGMFVQATFHGPEKLARAVVPASAILHLHDRDWVYTPAAGGAFRRIEVQSGQMVPPGQQEIISGLRPGDRVVTHALTLMNAAE